MEHITRLDACIKAHMETKEYKKRTYTEAVIECKALQNVREYLEKIQNELKNQKPSVKLDI
jgi:hypothetical protein